MKKINKILAAAAAAVITLTSAAFSTTASAKEYVFGDINGDGVFNEMDCYDILRMYVSVGLESDNYSKNTRELEVKYMTSKFGYSEADAEAVIDENNTIKVIYYVDSDEVAYTKDYLGPEDTTALFTYAYVKENEPDYVFTDYKKLSKDAESLKASKGIKANKFFERFNTLVQTDGRNYELKDVLPGDANGDGKLTAEDATDVLIKFAENSINSTNNAASMSDISDVNADYNCDGNITAEDATGILIQFAEESIG